MDKYWPYFVAGMQVTLIVTLFGVIVASLLGLVIALLRMSRFRPFSAFGDLYTQIFRGTPIFVFLIWVYYGAGMFLGIKFNAILAGLIAIGVLRAAYVAEIYRAGIQAVSKGQREAAQSVGLRQSQVMRYIVLPQAFRLILPAIGNEFVVVFKTTSILGLIGVLELVKQAQLATIWSFRPFELYTVLGLIFVAVVTLMSRGVKFLEKRMDYAN
jgi:His/Glu/Gln/Arg/opine family amino acid ABC transporter permease subunit